MFGDPGVDGVLARLKPDGRSFLDAVGQHGAIAV